jgi:hypothetical protein
MFIGFWHQLSDTIRALRAAADGASSTGSAKVMIHRSLT